VTAAFAYSGLCAVAVAGLLLAERRGMPITRAALKLLASSAFVAVAVVLGAAASLYGRLLLAGLALSWLGDALLLSRQSRPFLAGLAAFLLAHVCFTVAFVVGAFSATACAIAFVVALAVGAAIARWLWPFLGKFKAPVAAYLVTILAMCSAAAGFAAASSAWNVLLGAVLFAASDISVARDRFVAPGFVNKCWGWPLYFLAQLVLAWSVAAAR
jgi:uncharacterized membrane protein YhhN